MGDAAVLGRNPRVYTASGQTVSGGLYISRVLWDFPSTVYAGTMILREGASTSPTYICTLRAVTSQVQSISQEIRHYYRDVNVLTMSAGTLYVYTSRL